MRAQQVPGDEIICCNNRGTSAWKMVVCPVFSMINIVLFSSICIVSTAWRDALCLPRTSLTHSRKNPGCKSLKLEERQLNCTLFKNCHSGRENKLPFYMVQSKNELDKPCWSVVRWEEVRKMSIPCWRPTKPTQNLLLCEHVLKRLNLQEKCVTRQGRLLAFLDWKPQKNSMAPLRSLLWVHKTWW